MARSISIDKLTIKRVVIDIEMQAVLVDFTIGDSAGEFTRTRHAVFYRTAPLDLEGQPRALGQNEFLLTTTQANWMINLYQAVNGYLTNRFLG